MNDERADYLASGTEGHAPDREKLDLIREILGDEATWSEPPPEVADRLLATISVNTSSAATPAPRRRVWPWVAASGAAVVVVAALLLSVLQPADQELIAMEGSALVPAASGQASVHESGAGWWIRLDVDGLPAAEEGSYYEAWVWSDQGEGISVGTFHLRDDDEPIVLWSGVDPEDYPSLWVTLEPEDGNPAASDQIVMRGRSDGA